MPKVVLITKSDQETYGSQVRYPDPIPGIIRFGSVNLLAGASGVGKTCLITALLAQLRVGDTIFGHTTNPPVSIGYICADRGGETAQYWLDKAGSPQIEFYSLSDDPAFLPAKLRNKAQLVAILDSCLALLKLPPGSLVVIDPVALFMGGNLNDYQVCAIAMIEIRRLCTKRGLTLIGLAHAGKQKNDRKDQYRRLQDRILGSSALLGYGDTQMYLASPEETGEKFYTFLWHPHSAPPEVFPLDRDEEGRFVYWAGSSAAAIEGLIFASIPEDGSCVTWEFLLAVTNAPKTTLHRRLMQLLGDGLIERPVLGQYRRFRPQ
jgi:hypothetical protein